jgi:hypothetical protein
MGVYDLGERHPWTVSPLSWRLRKSAFEVQIDVVIARSGKGRFVEKLPLGKLMPNLRNFSSLSFEDIVILMSTFARSRHNIVGEFC